MKEKMFESNKFTLNTKIILHEFDKTDVIIIA